MHKLLLSSILCAVAGASYSQTILYVAPKGNDAWSGSLSSANAALTDGPKATLEGARDEIRARRSAALKAGSGNDGLPLGGYVVQIQAGLYERTSQFALDPSDSGNASSQIVYQGTNKNLVILDGTKAVGGWVNTQDPRVPSQARPYVFEASLIRNGYTNYGTLVRRSQELSTCPRAMTLYINGQKGTLAQFPNTGWDTVYSTDVQGFTSTLAKSKTWQYASDAYVHIFPKNDYHDYLEPVTSVDAITRRFRTASYLPDGTGYSLSHRIVYSNLIEELDSPGEYYIDRVSGKVFFMITPGAQTIAARVSVLDQPMFKLSCLSNVSIRNMTLRNGRASAIQGYNCNNVKAQGLVITGFGNHGAYLHGDHNSVLSCDISDIGETGVWLYGGDIAVLSPGYNEAVNNKIARVGADILAYRAGIRLEGVGNRAANNRITDVPHSAISIVGCQNAVEYNEVNRACQATDDAGGIYLGGFVRMGNVIRYNKVSRVVPNVSTPGERHQVVGIYIDNMASGVEIYGNIIQSVGLAFQVSGGRENKIDSNLVSDCACPLLIDSFGLADTTGFYITMIRAQLASIHPESSGWMNAFPWVATVLVDEPLAPKRDLIQHNIFVTNVPLGIHGLVPTDLIFSNYVGLNPGFFDLPSLDLRMVAGGNAAANGYVAPPTSLMGLYVDGYRLTLN